MGQQLKQILLASVEPELSREDAALQVHGPRDASLRTSLHAGGGHILGCRCVLMRICVIQKRSCRRRSTG